MHITSTCTYKCTSTFASKYTPVCNLHLHVHVHVHLHVPYIYRSSTCTCHLDVPYNQQALYNDRSTGLLSLVYLHRLGVS